jgi:hypothetical protein
MQTQRMAATERLMGYDLARELTDDEVEIVVGGCCGGGGCTAGLNGDPCADQQA